MNFYVIYMAPERTLSRQYCLPPFLRFNFRMNEEDNEYAYIQRMVTLMALNTTAADSSLPYGYLGNNVLTKQNIDHRP